jgi:nucleotide-binding universal stress UspA family protein
MAAPIVVGYDGTAGARAALDEGVRLAGAFEAELIVAFAYWTNPGGGEVADMVNALRQRGEGLLEEALEVARAAGVTARGELVGDRPDDGLASLAEEAGAQMIVVGSYGEAPLRAVILGSTPHRLIHVTRVPVLVVRGEATPAR